MTSRAAVSQPLGNEYNSDSPFTTSSLHNDAHSGGKREKEVHEPAAAAQLQSRPARSSDVSQTRQRVLRACDECRRGKIKCNGNQPCRHCAVYGYRCSYNAPSKRRRDLSPGYIEELEARLQRAEAVVQVAAPGVDLNDAELVASYLQRKTRVTTAQKQMSISGGPQDDTSISQTADEPLLETMMENVGALDLDDKGQWDYRGHSSSVLFMQRLQNQFGNLIIPVHPSRSRRPSQVSFGFERQTASPQNSAQDTDYLSEASTSCDLPPQDVARGLCRSCFDHACVLARFVHEPTFWAMFERIYSLKPSRDNIGSEEWTFRPLLYAVVAVGHLYSDDGGKLAGSDVAVIQGFRYFHACREMIDLADCRDLTSLQAICFMILFHQSASKLSTCYPYIGTALRAALRLGLHRKVAAGFNPIERELRKRVFWGIRNMDVYASTLLGLPLTLSNDDIDQDYPLEVDDEFITAVGILPMRPGCSALTSGSNAYTHLVDIIAKIVRNVYPTRLAEDRTKSDNTYMISYSKIREIERDLDDWSENLPCALQLANEGHPDLDRLRYALHISYGHARWIMYRPFLHYLISAFRLQDVDERACAFAADCVSVSQDIIQVATDMCDKQLVNGSSWFVMHVLYFATLTVIFVILEGPDLPAAPPNVLGKALKGKNTLHELAKDSMAVERRCACLYSLFGNLPEKIQNKRKRTLLRVPLVPATRQRDSYGLEDEHASSADLRWKRPRFAALPTTSSEQLRHGAGSGDNDTGTNSSHMHYQTDALSMQTTFLASPFPTPWKTQADSLSGPFLTSLNTLQPATITQHDNRTAMVPDSIPMKFPFGDPFAKLDDPMFTLEDEFFEDDPLASRVQLTKKPTVQNSTAAAEKRVSPNALLASISSLGPQSTRGAHTGHTEGQNPRPDTDQILRHSLDENEDGLAGGFDLGAFINDVLDELVDGPLAPDAST